MEDKKDYLIRTLSRTKRKDYENYVINRLYNRLNDLDIKPMTQKYIKRIINGKKGYCLIDLYFPQFNIGIECDEPHHISQVEKDKLRTEDIISELGNYNEQRITVYDKSIILFHFEVFQGNHFLSVSKFSDVHLNGNILKHLLSDIILPFHNNLYK